ncbi:MAG: glutamine-hydrolyzing carbamoyl-phosphate synthase small subunit [Firmicutes bacterium]|nr:glutamine-hydrolyzing carbamoyl-phosphate synthase small subunit [Bacillota bacterium]
MNAILVLEDGFYLLGEVFAGSGEVCGEIVCNTAMIGYQEIITDPTYRGQILSFTASHLGNHGCHPDDNESEIPRVKAVLGKSYCRRPRHIRSEQSLGAFLASHGVIGLEKIDTRSLMLHLRRSGPRKAIVSTLTTDVNRLMESFARFPATPSFPDHPDMAIAAPYRWNSERHGPDDEDNDHHHRGKEYRCHVAVMDLGVKRSILTALARRGCMITVVPADIDMEIMKTLNPDGLLLSNGPGDPMSRKEITAKIGSLLGWRPLAGIGLGHQIMGLSIGIDTFELPFGHRGLNHPVKELSTGRVLITAQNHGYNLSSDSPLPEGTAMTHINLNDGTLEGIENREYRFFSVQYHPRGDQSAHDRESFYDKFVGMCIDAKA